MTKSVIADKLTATGSRVAALVVVGVLFHSSGHAQQVLDAEIQAKILKGLQIAPVTLNMAGKDSDLVGYGSYLVNAVSDCNGCHTAGPPKEYTDGGNPYFSQPQTVNPATYLGGGNDFGAFPDPEGPFPHIVSRNLTPDGSGMPAGGNSLEQFIQIIRTGLDQGHVHPTCSGPPDGNCLPAPFNGDLLQIMPWPTFSNMTDFDLKAIYEYLSAIPCLEGGPNAPENRCGTGVKTTAFAEPRNATVTTRQVQLDGRKSTVGNGDSLSYLWTIARGSPAAAILAGNTATPTVVIGPARGIYTFQLTVRGATGKAATAFATVNFQGN